MLSDAHSYPSKLQLENVVIPGLQAEFLVVADRFAHTTLARNAVMGAARKVS